MSQLFLEALQPGHNGNCTLFGFQYPGICAKSINLTKLLRMGNYAGGNVTTNSALPRKQFTFEELVGVTMIFATLYFAEDLWRRPSFPFTHTR